MGIKFIKEGNVCGHCSKLTTEVGKMIHYKKHHFDVLLCENCVKEFDDKYPEKCPECRELISEHGGVSGLRGYEENGETKIHCFDCEEKRVKKIETNEIRKNFFKSNWKFWILLGIGIIGLLIARELI